MSVRLAERDGYNDCAMTYQPCLGAFTRPRQEGPVGGEVLFGCADGGQAVGEFVGREEASGRGDIGGFLGQDGDPGRLGDDAGIESECVVERPEGGEDALVEGGGRVGEEGGF